MQRLSAVPMPTCVGERVPPVSHPLPAEVAGEEVDDAVAESGGGKWSASGRLSRCECDRSRWADGRSRCRVLR